MILFRLLLLIGLKDVSCKHVNWGFCCTWAGTKQEGCWPSAMDPWRSCQRWSCVPGSAEQWVKGKTSMGETLICSNFNHIVQWDHGGEGLEWQKPLVQVGWVQEWLQCPIEELHGFHGCQGGATGGAAPRAVWELLLGLPCWHSSGQGAQVSCTSEGTSGSFQGYCCGIFCCKEIADFYWILKATSEVNLELLSRSDEQFLKFIFSLNVEFFFY